MINPINLIGHGIETGDWEKVVEGYQKMTGRKVKAPETVDATSFLQDLKKRIEKQLNTQPLKPVAIEPEEEEEDESDEDKDEEEEEESKPEPEPPRTEEQDPFAKFRVTHGQPKREDGKVASKAIPFARGSHKNTFVDDHKLAAKDIKDSKRFSKRRKPEPRRPPLQYVEIECVRCNKKENVHPGFVPPKLDAKDQRPQYICNGCVTGGK